MMMVILFYTVHVLNFIKSLINFACKNCNMNDSAELTEVSQQFLNPTRQLSCLQFQRLLRGINDTRVQISLSASL